MLRELELRVLAGVSGGMSCVPMPLESTPGGYHFDSPEHVVTTAELQMDIMAQAFACGVTRVGTIQIGHAGDTFGSRIHAPGIRMDGGDIDMGYLNEHNDVIHAFSEDPSVPGYAASLANRMDLERIYYTLFSRMLDRLAAIPEGDGSVLDNTVVMWCKSLGTDQSHKANPMLFMLAGGRNAGLRPGRFIDYTDRTPNELYVGIARRLGIDIDTFGQWGSVTYDHWGTTPIDL